MNRNTVDGVLLHVLYEIATGHWREGQVLPSVRRAEAEWGASRLTVLKAYQKLAEMGMAESKPRSGYVVVGGQALERVCRNRYLMEGLYEEVSKRIQVHEDLSVLGALRYLTRLAEQQYARSPEAVFVESSVIQAGKHASEIRERLQVPVGHYSFEQLGSDFRSLPRSVKTVLTTASSLPRLEPLAKRGIRIEAVPLEISPKTFQSSGVDVREAWLLDTSEEEIVGLMNDIEASGRSISLRPKIVSDVEEEIHRLLDARHISPRSLILLRPELWGSIHSALREHSRVAPIDFEIDEQAWSQVSDAIGMPFPSPIGL
ncbi:GntR family transcriptional regulator [Fimbriimonas ginsengisoli]|uniref:GntR family transcriptional regulator n=1 Tax=Fimbriimonas ginsengisoli TaxID=1005039 RepID=UPI00130D510F|nr:GntR family transcriptional regulator [Fimbriimonas ginsengisoli]